MKKRNTSCFFTRTTLSVGFLCLLLLSARGQATYTVTDLGTLGGSFSQAYAVNNRGQVVGWSLTNDGAAQHAFLYTGGQMLDLGTFGGSYSAAFGINNRGQVVGGSYISYNAEEHAFLYSGGKMLDLGIFGALQNAAVAINDQGQVVVSTQSARMRAFLYTNGQMLDLGTLGGSASQASGINDRGQVVGYSLTSGNAVLLQNLGTLGALWLETTTASRAFRISAQASCSLFGIFMFVFFLH
jgi:probable HAF family extracellular repeat protein